MVHKEREAGKKGGEAAAELKADLKAMEKEREVKSIPILHNLRHTTCLQLT